MGIFGIGEKKREKEPLGVCIPRHGKKEIKKSDDGVNGEIKMSSTGNDEIPEAKQKQKKTASTFRVDGKYEVADTLMISGMVEFGTMKKGMTAEIEKGELKVTELRVGSEKVSEIKENQSGTIFVRARGTQNIKYNDLLEFS
ncbi:MAG: hypothetical protein WC308_02120 [archaeon]|jgi:hypothetical protein